MGESGQDETKGDVLLGGALNLSSVRVEGRNFFSWVEVLSENVATFYHL